MSTLTAPDKRGQPKAVKDPLEKRRPAAGGELRPITRKPASPRTPAGPAPPSLAYPIPPADPPPRIRQTNTARPLHP